MCPQIQDIYLLILVFRMSTCLPHKRWKIFLKTFGALNILTMILSSGVLWKFNIVFSWTPRNVWEIRMQTSAKRKSVRIYFLVLFRDLKHCSLRFSIPSMQNLPLLVFTYVYYHTCTPLWKYSLVQESYAWMFYFSWSSIYLFQRTIFCKFFIYKLLTVIIVYFKISSRLLIE